MWVEYQAWIPRGGVEGISPNYRIFDKIHGFCKRKFSWDKEKKVAQNFSERFPPSPQIAIWIRA